MAQNMSENTSENTGNRVGVCGDVQRLTLVPHPTSARDGVDAVTVDVGHGKGVLSFCFTLAGDIERAVLPDIGSADRTDGLWRHTCFEAFISDGDAYCEYNFSASMQWAAYQFTQYRADKAPVKMAPPRIERAAAAGAFHLYTELSLANIPLQGARPWRLGLSAVIEMRDSALAYWALRHDKGPPDFHRASCFNAQIP